MPEIARELSAPRHGHRKKDTILRGGFNVSPRQVEEVLYAHPAIAEVAVIGIAHTSHGKR